MAFGLVKSVVLGTVILSGVGSRGPVKYSNVTISRVRKDYWSVSFTYPRFQPVTAVTDLANRDLVKVSQASVREWAGSVTKDMEKPNNAWIEEYTPTVVTARPDLVSVQVTQYMDTEGAHPNTVQLTFNYGFVGGGAKRLVLRDLFRPRTRPLPLISRIVIAKLREKGASWIVDGQVKALDAKQADEFVIKRDRLTYIFSPYEMGSYAEGTYEVDVPFASLAGKLNANGPLRTLLVR